MSIYLEIPDSITQAMRLPPQKQKQQMLIELAVSLYGQGILSFGKARELAGMSHRAFSVLLGEREIPRHYSQEELEDDLNYARGQ